jgi:hypothetical protein
MATEAKLLIVQFLEWVAARPRRYAEVREAWSSTCPLNCAWEDAVAEGLVHHEADGHIVLTARGRARLPRPVEAARSRESPRSPLPLLLDCPGGVS